RGHRGARPGDHGHGGPRDHGGHRVRLLHHQALPDALLLTAMPEAIVEAHDLRKNFDANEALRGVPFVLANGETLVVMGGSGAGKTVLLRLVAGLVRPDGGRLRVFGRSIENLSEEALLPLRRRMGYVFQSAALFDSLSVHDNVAYPLREHTSLGEAEID